MDVVIYTDGSVSKNGQPEAIGGWACILQAYRGETMTVEAEKSGKLTFDTDGVPVTNNRAEMYAVLKALQSIEKRCNVIVCSDSELVVKTLNGEYSKRNNIDLWDRIESVIGHLKEINCKIEIKWVKGHSNDALNNRVDKLASNAKKGMIK